jgi:hypothetical protein
VAKNAPKNAAKTRKISPLARAPGSC